MYFIILMRNKEKEKKSSAVRCIALGNENKIKQLYVQFHVCVCVCVCVIFIPLRNISAKGIMFFHVRLYVKHIYERMCTFLHRSCDLIH